MVAAADDYSGVASCKKPNLHIPSPARRKNANRAVGKTNTFSALVDSDGESKSESEAVKKINTPGTRTPNDSLCGGDSDGESTAFSVERAEELSEPVEAGWALAPAKRRPPRAKPLGSLPTGGAEEEAAAVVGGAATGRASKMGAPCDVDDADCDWLLRKGRSKSQKQPQEWSFKAKQRVTDSKLKRDEQRGFSIGFAEGMPEFDDF